MNQDECFEKMTRQLNLPDPSLGYSNGIRHQGYSGASERDAAESLILGIMSVNFFSCSIIQTAQLAASRTWLHRMESGIERHGDQFLFKASYRVHSSSDHRWNNSDVIYTLESDIQSFYRELPPQQRNLRPTSRKYGKAVDKLYSALAGRTIYSSYPIDGRVITVLIGGKIPKRQILDDERTFSLQYTTLEDSCRLRDWNRINGFQFDSSRGVLDTTFSDHGLPHGESFPICGRLTMCERETEAIDVGTITDADRRLLNKQTYYSDESLYTEYIPRPESLTEVLVPDDDGWSLYLRKDALPAPIQGKELNDWLVDTTLHVSSTIELFRLSDERSIRLEPGVYQLLYHDEEKRLTESLFVYTDNVRRLVESNYRATFPSGKLQAMTVASDGSVVNVSHINVKNLTLPSESTSVTSFFQRSKDI